MWEFGNRLNWDLALRNTYYAKTSQADPKAFVPIPSITINVNSYIVLIGARNAQAKSNWYLAGYASPRLLFSPSSTSEFLSIVQSNSPVKIGLDRLTLVTFSNYNLLPYILEISIAKWHKEMFLEIWQYSGATEEIKPALDRIEYKIDNLNF